MTALLMRGDVQGAAAAQRRAEILMLEEGQHLRYPGTTARSELHVYAILEDIAGLKDVEERVTKAASAYPQWKAYAHMARHHYRRLRGDPVGALAALLPALQTVAPLAHREWPGVVAAHVQALSELGRTEEALRFGHDYLETCRNLELHPGVSQLTQAIATALLAAGLARDAAALADGLIAEAVRSSISGLPLGMLHELRARAALGEGDMPAFSRNLELCGDQYRVDVAPALTARYQRLAQEAHRQDTPRSHPTSPLEDVESGLATIATALTSLQPCLEKADDA